MNTITVPFYDNELYVVEHNNEPYVPMKPIVEGMGMDWKSQFDKIKQRFKSTMVEITIVAADGKMRDMICLPLRKLSGWMLTIYPNKVKSAIRDKVVQFQDECDDVLYKYWTTGQVINPRKRSIMEQLNDACADFKREEAIASKFGKGLNMWKEVKPQHEQKMSSLARQAGELMLDLFLVEVGKGRTTKSDL